MVKVIKKNLKQYDCGIVAAFNILSWCKKPQKYTTIEIAAMAMFDYQPECGISGSNFEKLVEYFEAPINKMPGVTVEEIQESVYTGKAVILTYKLIGDPIGHIIMVVLGKDGKVNTINGETRKITWDELASDIDAGGSAWFFAWELPHRNTL